MIPEIKLASYNVSVLYDSRNVLLRTGKNSTSESVREQYTKIKEIYDANVIKFEQQAEQIWWKHPYFQVSEGEQPLFLPNRNEAMKNICKNIFQNNDIVLLQEIETKDTLELIKGCLPEGCKLIFSGDEKKLDTAIVWNSKRFEWLTKSDLEERKVAMVTLKDLNSGKIITAASVHVPGYNIMAPKKEMKANEIYLSGDQLIHTTLKQMQLKAHDADLSIVGGDFNGEYESEFLKSKEDLEGLTLAKRRFKLLEDDGYLYVQNALKTAYNKDLEAEKPAAGGLCTLDHVFLKSKDDLKVSIEQCVEESNKYPTDGVSKNPSDHLPLFYTIKLN
jgi:endonuclease/exonuclease/phosphatase family metal-dependent hydrolase